MEYHTHSPLPQHVYAILDSNTFTMDKAYDEHGSYDTLKSKNLGQSEQQGFTALQKVGIITVLCVLVSGGWYFLNRSEGSTEIALTLTTPGGPTVDLNRGLVAHYTFDGPDIDWGSTTAEIKDRSGNGNHGNAKQGLSPTSGPTHGVIGQALKFSGDQGGQIGGPFIEVPDYGTFGSSNVITMTAWVNAAATSASPYGKVIMGRRGGVNDAMYGILRDDATKALKVSFKQISQPPTYDYNLVSTPNSLPLNTWTHVAATLAADGTITTYINGLKSTSQASSGIVIDSTPTPLAVGFQLGNNSAMHFDGTLDDVRVYNRALSAEEVKRLYELGATTRISETVTSNPTLETGLVAHYTFDGPDIDWSSTTAEIRDRSGNGNHGNALGTMAATTSPVHGVMGQALQFNGVDDAIYLGTPTDFDLSQENAFTIGAWVKPDQVYFSAIFSRGSVNSGADNEVYHLGFGWDPGRVFAQASDGVVVSRGIFNGTDGTAVTGIWQYIVATYDGSSVRTYKNGAIVDTSGDLSGSTLWDGDETQDRQTGIGYDARNDRYYFHGTLDDVRIYNRALSAEEVKRLYELGATTRISETLSNPTLDSGLVAHYTFDGPDIDWGSTTAEIKDRSGNGNHGNAQGTMAATTSPVHGVMGQALQFNGVNDYVDIGGLGTLGANMNSTGLSASLWFKTKQTTRFVLLGGNHMSNRWAGIDINLRGANTVRSALNSPEWDAYASAGINLSDGNWHHLAESIDVANRIGTFYVDGVARSTVYTQQGAVTDGAFATTFLGALNNGTPILHSKATIDDVRVYARTLSADDVKRLYDMGR